MKLFLLPSIGNQLLYHLKIKKRLAAEEIHFQVLSVS